MLQKLKKIYQLSQSSIHLEKLLSTESDIEMKDLYLNEISGLDSEICFHNDELIENYSHFLNEDVNEVLVEIRAGTGGAEAALFASELCDLYKLFFQFKNWNYQTISESRVGAHTKEVIMALDGNCFSGLFSETGVHRVQRVPETESQGRIHTSTVSVAVIPQKTKTETSIDDKDVRIDVYRSSGPGGQNVNKTNSAVRLVHIPTGITVCMQDERSQVENRLRAFKVLKMRIEDRARTIDQQQTKSIRAEQIGTGERSDKIRTYNFPQSRVTDHRLPSNNQNLVPFFEDPSLLDELIMKYRYFKLIETIDDFVKELK